MKISDYIVEQLLSNSVERIYGIVGDSLNPISDTIRRSEGAMELVNVRHEEVAAFAAGAEAQLTGNLTVCAGSCGPGSLHLLNGLYDAHASSAPVLALVTHISTSEIGTQYHQETHPELLFSECSDFCELVSTPAALPRLLHIAMQSAVANNSVSVLILPEDVVGGKVEKEWRSHIAVSRPVVRPQDVELQRFAELIDGSERPAIYSGIGAGDAHDAVIELSEKIKAPIGHTFRGKDRFEADSPNDIGMTGLLGFGSTNHAFQECDLLIMAGTDFPYRAFLPDGVKTVQIDLRGERLGRRIPLELGLVGDVGETVRGVLPLVAERGDSSFLEDERKRYQKSIEGLQSYVDHVGEQHPIHPEYVAATLDKLADDDTVFAVDTGMSTVWGARYIHGSGRRRILGSFRHGTMANAMPQTIGAQYAAPDKQVIALCGDGGLSMLLGDLFTIVQENLPIKLIVFNNGVLGMVQLEMLVAGLPEFGTDIADHDFAAIAKAAGMHGVSVKERDGVEAGLREVLEHDGPALCDVKTDPNALSMPPRITVDETVGFGLSMIKKSLDGHIGEVLDTAKSNIRNMPRP